MEGKKKKMDTLINKPLSIIHERIYSIVNTCIDANTIQSFTEEEDGFHIKKFLQKEMESSSSLLKSIPILNQNALDKHKLTSGTLVLYIFHFPFFSIRSYKNNEYIMIYIGTI